MGESEFEKEMREWKQKLEWCPLKVEEGTTAEGI